MNSRRLRILVTIGLVILAGVLIAARRGGGPPVEWTPEKVTETVVSGQETTVEVVFTSRRHLRDLELHVARGINSFVTVSPASIKEVRANEPTRVVVAIAPSVNTENGFTLYGEVQIRDQAGQSEAQPLPIEVTVVREGRADRSPRTSPMPSPHSAGQPSGAEPGTQIPSFFVDFSSGEPVLDVEVHPHDIRSSAPTLSYRILPTGHTRLFYDTGNVRQGEYTTLLSPLEVEAYIDRILRTGLLQLPKSELQRLAKPRQSQGEGSTLFISLHLLTDVGGSFEPSDFDLILVNPPSRVSPRNSTAQAVSKAATEIWRIADDLFELTEE